MAICVGIAGGTGSGKSTLARAVIQAMPDRAALIELDWYYRDISHLSESERNQTNFDDPGAIEFDLLTAHLDRLLAGQAVDAPVYDFSRHLRTQEVRPVDPRPVLLIEGLHALSYAPLRDRMLIRVFVDAPPDLRLVRRLQRDLLERGRSVDSVLTQYQEQVRPMHQAWVEPSRRHATMVISGESAAEDMAASLIAAINACLAADA